MDDRQCGIGFIRTEEVGVSGSGNAVKGPAGVLRCSGWLRGLLPAATAAGSAPHQDARQRPPTNYVHSSVWIEDNL